jgi:hypothetical protein
MNAGSINIPNEINFDTIFDRLKKKNIISSQTELGKILGVGRAAISYVAQKRGKTPPEWVRRFEDAGYCWRWVATGEGPMYNPNYVASQGRLVVANRIIDVKDGELVFSSRDIELPLHISYLSSIGVKFSNTVSYFVVQGDSMDPSLKQGDICLIDKSQKKVDTGQYFLFSFVSGQLGVRKVFINGISVELLFENKSYPNAKFDDSNTQVIGRVVSVFKKM